MKLLDRIIKYFDTLHDFKSPAASHLIEQNAPITQPPKYKILMKEFSVFLNGERVDITINNGTITLNTKLNIVINTPVLAVKTESGVHLNPDTLNIEDLKRTFNENREYYDYTMNCVNCEEPVK